jgi:four helix bundle protein
MQDECMIQDTRSKIRSMNYKDLEIYQIAHKLAVEIHRMSLTLPSFEVYEEASQIRRSSKGVASCIVEGYGRRRYKNDFIRFLVFAQASIDETREHLDLLYETGSLKDEKGYRYFNTAYDELGRKTHSFTKAVETKHLT